MEKDKLRSLRLKLDTEFAETTRCVPNIYDTYLVDTYRGLPGNMGRLEAWTASVAISLVQHITGHVLWLLPCIKTSLQIYCRVRC